MRQAIDGQRIKPYLDLWFKITHLATSQGEPYTSITRTIGESFDDWIKQIYVPVEREDVAKQTALLFVFTEGLVVLNKIGLEERMDAAVEGMIDLYERARIL